MTRFLLIYHRQPFEEVLDDQGQTQRIPPRSPNGIVPSLTGFLQHLPHPDGAGWLAWRLTHEEEATVRVDEVRVEASRPNDNPLRVLRLGLTQAEVGSFYHVTSKAALWPILHSFPSEFDEQAANWERFQAVNRKFAQAAAQSLEAGGTAWIHDYNLWLVPGYLRALRPDLTIGFFLHTPFPGPDVFGILPWREEILRSLLCADRVGFHVARYAENFAQSAECFCRAEPSRRRSVGRHLAQLGSVLHQVSYPTALLSKDHRTHVDVAPIGINTQLIQQVLRRRQTGLEIANIRAQLGVEKIIFSVGRIDYTKGSKEVLDGFDRLLSRHPEWVGRVKLVLTSVAPAKGMSVYEDIQLEIEQRVGNINGRYSELNWVPVLLFTTPIGFEELVAWYAAADICWITPLRDGLNLVAKEYAMAQQDRAGVLILSEFAGSVIELDEAIHVNPYSRDSMDAGLDRALTMTPEEAMGRMRAMGQRLRLRSLSSWTRRMTELFANRELTLDPAE